jgi:hypothetical protein
VQRPLEHQASQIHTRLAGQIAIESFIPLSEGRNEHALDEAVLAKRAQPRFLTTAANRLRVKV